MSSDNLPDSEDLASKKRKREMAEVELRNKQKRRRSKQATGEVNGRGISVKSASIPAKTNGSELSLPLIPTDPPRSTIDGVIIPSKSIRSRGQDNGWAVSKSYGGRILDIDPILTHDERHLILICSSSVHVYTTADSLLLRQIPIIHDERGSRIVGAKLSSASSNILWLACSDGHLFKIDWTTATSKHRPLRTGSLSALSLDTINVELSGKQQELLLVVERRKESGYEIVAYSTEAVQEPEHKILISLTDSQQGVWLLSAIKDSGIILGAIRETVLVGTVASLTVKSIEDLQCEFYRFDIPDVVCSLDAALSERQDTTPLNAQLSENKPNRKVRTNPEATSPVVNIIVGGARGAIYYYNDLVAKLRGLGVAGSSTSSIQARKYHWHRRAVRALKWSRDGNYMISGGSENTLVIWQVDTGKLNFLPHLGGAVENIAVSEAGSSYVVHMDDNSAMVLSTAELEPTVYVSGLQSAIHNATPPKDLWVNRTWALANMESTIPLAISPANDSRLYVSVGNGSQASVSGANISTPFLQTIDIETFRSTSKQAIARTQTSDNLITHSTGAPISDPEVTHITFSHDGKWLATVDDWQPPSRDSSVTVENERQKFSDERREIYLKFWEVTGDDEPLTLSSRVNSPHVSTHSEPVLDLASDPLSTRFATVGGDATVRIWEPRVRQKDGITITNARGSALYSWSCSQSIALGNPLNLTVFDDASSQKHFGRLCFSEDGSSLFVAYGNGGDGNIYVLDASKGTVRFTLEGLWKGPLRGLRLLSPYLIVLSDELKVFDVVADDVCYGMPLNIHQEKASLQRLIQLEVDYRSRRFLVSVPQGGRTELAVFRPDDPTPLMAKQINSRVTGIIASPSSSGFLVLDDQAQLRTVSIVNDTAALLIARPLEEMQLSASSEEAHNEVDQDMQVENGEDASDVENEEGEDDAMDIDEDQGADAVVIRQHQLSEIFDVAPAFAMPPIEDMFYKVAGLIASRTKSD